MDVRLRSALVELQERQKAALKAVEKDAKDGREIIELGRAIYKQAITDQPDWAGRPLWDALRRVCGIPPGAIEVERDAQAEQAKADLATVKAIDAVSQVGGLSSIPQNKKVELIAQLEQAVANAKLQLL